MRNKVEMDPGGAPDARYSTRSDAQPRISGDCGGDAQRSLCCLLSHTQSRYGRATHILDRRRGDLNSLSHIHRDTPGGATESNPDAHPYSLCSAEGGHLNADSGTRCCTGFDYSFDSCRGRADEYPGYSDDYSVAYQGYTISHYYDPAQGFDGQPERPDPYDLAPGGALA